ncbi:MAG TPA: glycosyltransferase family 39 protein [Anaerolineales bacterium]|nr:glycosyltransferase family 39 protein [Anaerolineales bacterium]
MLMFFLALIILLVSSLPWAATTRTQSKPAWLMALYLVCSANVVLTGYIVNSFRVLNQQWIVLTFHIIIGGVGWLIWQRVGRPSLWGVFENGKYRFNIQVLRREPILSLFTLVVTLFYGFALVQIIMIPQNNTDALSTHLSRIGFWHQLGSFFPWPTFMFNQVWYPVNAQLQTYWTLLFLGNDRLVGVVQWLAVIVSGIGVFGLARFYGYKSRQSAFAALLFLSFPLVALQSTTTQTDLVAAAFFIPAVYFLFTGLRDGQKSLLILSAVSIGIGFGVKKSYFLLLPILGVLAVLAVFQFWKQGYKQFIFWAVASVFGISFLGAYSYVVNWQIWGGLFGSPTYVDSLLETPKEEQEIPKVQPRLVKNLEMKVAFPGSDILLELAYNTPRLLYQAIDTSGLPRPLDGYAHKVKARIARPIFQWIGFEEIEGTAYTAPGHVFSFEDKNINEESHAWYGPLSAILLFPALIIEFRRGRKERNYLLMAPSIALLIFLPFEIILRPGWDPFQGRYFAPLIAFGSPLMARWFKEKGNAIYEWLISGFAIIILGVTMLYNPSKPTLGKFADEFHIWNNDRVFIQTIQRKNNRTLYYRIEKIVPADGTLGYYIPFYILDYPLFGEDLNRRLVPMVKKKDISNFQWLREQGIDYLLMPKQDDIPLPPPEYKSISQMESWILYEYVPIP